MIEFLELHGSKIVFLILGAFVSTIIKYVASGFREKKQKKQQLFEDYSKRYSEILSSLLSECESFDSEFNKESPIQRKLVLQFIMLLSEEHFLNDKKLIAPDIWDIWKSGIEYHFEKRFFITAWKFSKKQMDLKGPFSDLVESYIDTKEETIHEAVA